MKKTMIAYVAAVLLCAPVVTLANDAQHQEKAGLASDLAKEAQGEVRKVDKEQAKITLKHGPLTNLDMPAMTMVFRVKDKAMLDQVSPGDKVSFVAEKINEQLTITRISATN